MAEGDPNILKILVASDLHIGYAEKDPIRGEDSFLVFEEILQHAKLNQVDFVLLGGDLFHENKPSRRCMHKVMELLRKYTLGTSNVNFQILSDQTVNFHTSFAHVNYEDPNYKVSLPIFTIHGNHDDPAGDGRYSALDILSVANLINYFGKSENIDDITIYPILLQKGETKIALYGLGNIRDERLYRTFQQKKVKLMRTNEGKDDWFNIFVLHQNRAHHNQKSTIHEVMFDTFLDLVVWGHEHECRITPEPSAVADFHIIQPGSPVATSLCDGEVKKKHVGILEIRNEQWRMRPIPLETVRPFIMEDCSLKEAEGYDITNEEEVIEFLSAKVEKMIERAKNEFKRRARPLIRLRVDATGGTKCHPARFGQRFVDKVANPTEILLFQKKKISLRPKVAGSGNNLEADDDQEDLDVIQNNDETSISHIIRSFLSTKDANLGILPENELYEAVQSFVEKDSKNAIEDSVIKSIKETERHLLSETSLPVEDLDQIEEIIRCRTTKINDVIKQEKLANRNVVANNDDPQDDEEFSKVTSPVASPITVKKENSTKVKEEKMDIMSPITSTPKRKTPVKRSPAKKNESPAPETPTTDTKPGRKRKFVEVNVGKVKTTPKSPTRSAPSTPVKNQQKGANIIALSSSDEDDNNDFKSNKKVKLEDDDFLNNKAKKWGRKKF